MVAPQFARAAAPPSPAVPALPAPLRRCTREEKGAAQTDGNIGWFGTPQPSSAPKPCSPHPGHSLCCQLGSFQPLGLPTSHVLTRGQRMQARSWALGPHHSTGPGAQAGWGKRQTPISLTRLVPVLLLAQSSSFHSLRGSASLPHFIPTNVSPSKWEPETGTETRTVAREERGADFRGRQRAGEGDLNRHPGEDPPGRPSELRGQQS